MSKEQLMKNRNYVTRVKINTLKMVRERGFKLYNHFIKYDESWVLDDDMSLEEIRDKLVDDTDRLTIYDEDEDDEEYEERKQRLRRKNRKSKKKSGKKNKKSKRHRRKKYESSDSEESDDTDDFDDDEDSLDFLGAYLERNSTIEDLSKFTGIYEKPHPEFPNVIYRTCVAFIHPKEVDKEAGTDLATAFISSFNIQVNSENNPLAMNNYVFVSPYGVTHQLRSSLNNSIALPIYMNEDGDDGPTEHVSFQTYTYDNLMHNIIDNILVPKYTLLRNKDIAEINKENGNFISKKKLVSIYSTDPIAKYYDARPGNVFEIYNNVKLYHSHTSDRINYRYVIDKGFT